MPLVELPLPPARESLPPEIEAFCREALIRSEQLLERRGGALDSFVPSDPRALYPALLALSQHHQLSGNMFCEWGSGLGTAACLAAMLNFAAYGIEVEAELVDAARQLADDFDAAAVFVCGSFIPEQMELAVDFTEFAWLDTGSQPAYDELGFDIDDFDVIFAYPWPGERGAIDQIFLRCARDGALLVTCDAASHVVVHRKVRRERRRSG